MTQQQRLKNMTLLEVGFKSLFLEASWNHQGQQNLGLAAAVDPALRKIYGPGEHLQQARSRYLKFFNTNPMSSGLMIGLMLRLEEDMANDHLALDQRDKKVHLYSGALAALGDNIFWQTWLPLCSLVTVWAVLSFPQLWWPPCILPLLFCFLALPVRFVGLILAYRHGQEIVDKLPQLKLQDWIRGLKRLTAVLLGSSTMILLSQTSILAGYGSLTKLWLSFGGVLLFVFILRTASAHSRLVTYWSPLIVILIGFTLLSIFNELIN